MLTFGRPAFGIATVIRLGRRPPQDPDPDPDPDPETLVGQMNFSVASNSGLVALIRSL